MISTLLAGGLKSFIGVIVVFLVLVTIHEFGHFIVAKKAGVFVPKFAIGFGPPIFKFGKGETEYSIRLFPLGGFVVLAGEVPQDTYFKLGEQLAVVLNSQGEVELMGDPDQFPNGITGSLAHVDTVREYVVALSTEQGYRQFAISRQAYLVDRKDRIQLVPPDRQMGRKPLLSRMLIVFAGPLMNALLTVVLFSILSGITGVVTSPPQLASISAGSPAMSAGLHSGDVITGIDGHQISNWQQLVTAIQTPGPKGLTLSVDRVSKPLHIQVTPRVRSNGMRFIGVTPVSTHNVVAAVEDGARQTGLYTQLIYNALGNLFTHQGAFVQDVAGPVKIVAVIGQQAQLGILNLINLTAILSLNLAIFNLLPIPALDGSRLLFMFVELFRGKPIDPRKEYLVHAVGFALLILLTVFRTYLDVAQLL